MSPRIISAELRGWDKLTTEQIARIEAITGKPVKINPDGCLEYSSLGISATLEDLLSIGIAFTVEKDQTDVRVSSAYVESLFDRFKKMEERQEAPAPVNEKCNVVVAGAHLLHIDTVQVVENYCTNELQTRLNEGWRILAVCVQPDGRRPDYVLGMTGGAR